ncbi:hypothetical protein HS7_16200 [Sulfolobales archaeon HS-7]|nr:hypothetical protein HS7_16200 [Sulfolobales archaeon HS-7]
MKYSGVLNVKDLNSTKQKATNKNAFIQCIPGIKSVNGDKFYAEANMGFLKVELNGNVEEFSCSDERCVSKVLINAPGLVIKVNTTLEFSTPVKWSAEVDISGPMANMARSMAEEKVKEISEQIMQCITA